MTWNGQPGWGPPWPADLILSELRELRRVQNQTMGALGQLQGGLRTGLENDREIYTQLREVRERVTRLEARAPANLLSSGPAGPQPTATPGLLTGLTTLVEKVAAAATPLNQLLVSAAMLAAALGVFLTAPTPPQPQAAPIVTPSTSSTH